MNEKKGAYGFFQKNMGSLFKTEGEKISRGLSPLWSSLLWVCNLVLFLVGNIGVFKSLAVYGFANLAGLAPIPATLGALELGEGFAFGVLGLGFGIGTVFSMAWRAADLLLALIGLVFLIKFGTRVLQEKVLKLFDKK